MVISKEPEMMVSHTQYDEPTKPTSAEEASMYREPTEPSTAMSKLMAHEGFRLNPYKDTKGYLTGGTGHKMTEEDIKQFDTSWSDDKKLEFWTEKFDEDFTKASTGAIRLMSKHGVEDNPTIQGVVTNMIFNMGESGVSKFKNFFSALSNNDMEKAIYEMKHDSKGNKSPYYADVGKRVDELAEELINI